MNGQSRQTVTFFQLVIVRVTPCLAIFLALANCLDSTRSSENLQRFLDRGEVVGRDQHSSRLAVPGDSDAVMSSFDVCHVL